MATRPPPHPRDGEVRYLVWGNVGPIKLHKGINAYGVRDPGVYFASYTWDEATRTLHIETPAMGEMTRATDVSARKPANIENVHIDAWDDDALTVPADWDGPTTGRLRIVFIPRGVISGPVGTVNYP